jgi:hypothetical protein
MRGTKWKHWKEGRVYEVLDVALHSETREELVVYRRVGDEAGQLWARPLSMWLDEARPGVRRFVPAETEDTTPQRCYFCGHEASTRVWTWNRHVERTRVVVRACLMCAEIREATDQPVGLQERVDE